MVAALRAALLTFCATWAAGQAVRVRLHDGLRRVPLETYVEWVLAGEAGAVTAPEALKAMAVTARTYARANLGRHWAGGFDFCETTHCQDARPQAVTAPIRRAAEETQGIVLWYRGRPAEVFYSRNCGGRTASGAEVWPAAARPYLPSREDSFCNGEGARPWTVLVAWPDLARALQMPGLRYVAVERRTASGRAATLRTNLGPAGAGRLHFSAGRSLGWNVLPSRLYDVESTPSGAIFRGKGSGHGVGLCQNGAERRAKTGHLYTEILGFYFPGARPGISARDIPWRVERGETVELWSAGGGAGLLALAERLWPEARRRSGLGGPPGIQIRVYPSVAVFRDATGEAGSAAAVTRGRVIHLQPPARLADPAQLERILLHEMMHVLISANARAELPGWFEEGLAEYLGGGTIRTAERRRVEALIERYGRGAVFAMLQSGLVQ